MTTIPFIRKNCWVFLLTVSIYTFAQSPSIQLQQIVTGLNFPTDLASAQDSRLFISENTGKIRIVSNNAILPTPFLDISSKVFDLQWQGIYCFAFHPQYATNGRFYVLYYRQSDGQAVLSEFNVSTSDPNIADPTEYQLLTIPYTNGHKGADMAFGKDGYLYITAGDNASGDRGATGDPTGHSQNLSLLFGKILRIDVSQPHQYSIPPTNPFTAPNDNIPDEIWALGLRNPWRMTFDSATGDLWIGDNGQDGWEEVDFWQYENTATANFGWSCFEGNHAYNSSNCSNTTPNAFPILEFPGYDNNGGNSASVIGGYVYRGAEYPNLYGQYIYANYSTGEFWTLKRLPNVNVVNVSQGVLTSNPVGFGQNNQGDLFVINFFDGILYKITNNQPCPTTLTLTTYDPIQNSISMKAADSIVASNQLFPNVNINFQAGKSIELTPRFEAKNGTTFVAKIAGCQ